MDSEYFRYIYNCDLGGLLSIKIGTLEGTREKPTYQELLDNPMLKFSGRNQDCADLQAECIIYAGSKNITMPILTSYKPFTTRWIWSEWLQLPIKFCDLPRNSILLITIYDYEAPRKKVIVGGTSIPLIDEKGVFPRGLLDLRVWPEKAGHPVETPGIGPLVDGKDDEMHRLNKLVKKHESGEIPRVDWLDRLVFREINVLNDQNKRSSKFMYLTIEFPQLVFKGLYYHIVWWEKGVEPDHGVMNKYVKDMPLYDPELGLENLYESKHHHLTRALQQSGVTDRDLKPNSTNRDILLNIIQYPPTTQLTNHEQDLVWKYRFFLKNHKKGLAKFLKCVKWNLVKEAEQALLLLNEWSRLDAHDALELLGPEFDNPQIRKYAVERLDSASDDELLLYLLQLVQALKYESWEVKSMHLLDESHYSLESEQHCTDSSNLSWKPSSLTNNFINLNIEDSKENEENTVPSLFQTKRLDQQSDLLLEGNPFTNSGENLASFLIKRSHQNHILANYFYWYLLIECEDKSPEQGLKPESKVREMYLWVMNYFKVSLQRSSKQTLNIILRQQQFVDKLVAMMQTVHKESGRPKKIEKLKAMLADPELNLKEFESLPLPLNPEIKICGIVPEEATLFKSALEPCMLTFKTVDGSKYITIFKSGDDLRQDQLIIQIITLMDKLLLNENMDLKLTPYKVLATSSRHGFVQYIDSVSIAELGRRQTNIQTYLKENNKGENPGCGIPSQVMDNYLRSCAGYCIITYILGIGDRHFDNLLLTKDGHLFHIDFGYILGRDPKPLAPYMKLTKEMVDAMGGLSSDNYKEFQRLCYTTYAQLRRHSSLVLNLFSLMVDANVPDIALEPDKTTKKVEDRFCLNLNDEEAVGHVQEVIDQSMTAVVAQVVEQFHRLAQYMRK